MDYNIASTPPPPLPLSLSVWPSYSLKLYRIKEGGGWSIANKEMIKLLLLLLLMVGLRRRKSTSNSRWLNVQLLNRNTRYGRRWNRVVLRVSVCVGCARAMTRFSWTDDLPGRNREMNSDIYFACAGLLRLIRVCACESIRACVCLCIPVRADK